MNCTCWAHRTYHNRLRAYSWWKRFLPSVRQQCQEEAFEAAHGYLQQVPPLQPRLKMDS